MYCRSVSVAIGLLRYLTLSHSHIESKTVQQFSVGALPSTVPSGKLPQLWKSTTLKRKNNYQLAIFNSYVSLPKDGRMKIMIAHHASYLKVKQQMENFSLGPIRKAGNLETAARKSQRNCYASQAQNRPFSERFPSGKGLHNYGKSMEITLFHGKITISMAIFHSYATNYTISPLNQ